MSIKLTNVKELSKYLNEMSFRIEEALIYQLEYLIAELENHAKLSADYTDQTSNLKSSIGGVVLKDGRPITYRGFSGSGKEGGKTGLEYINQLINDNKNGYVLLVVAGMEYATYVENYHELNVLKKSELKMQREIPKILTKLKSKINKLK